VREQTSLLQPPRALLRLPQGRFSAGWKASACFPPDPEEREGALNLAARTFLRQL
jgi:hypothetical protein